MARNGTSIADIRSRVIAVLQADATVTAVVSGRVYDTRALEVQANQVPCLVVYVRAERGTLNGFACLAPNFATEFDIEVELHVTGSTDAEMGANADLTDAILTALLSDETLGRLVDGWVRYDRIADFGADERSKRGGVAVVRITGQGQVSFTVGA